MPGQDAYQDAYDGEADENASLKAGVFLRVATALRTCCIRFPTALQRCTDDGQICSVVGTRWKRA